MRRIAQRGTEEREISPSSDLEKRSLPSGIKVFQGPSRFFISPVFFKKDQGSLQTVHLLGCPLRPSLRPHGLWDLTTIRAVHFSDDCLPGISFHSDVEPGYP